MKLSHSKLSTILNCPMTYYLSYIEKISLKDKKPPAKIIQKDNNNPLKTLFKNLVINSPC